MSIFADPFGLDPLLPDASDVADWRLAYKGGREFRDRYLHRIIISEVDAGTGQVTIDVSQTETLEAFAARKEATPVPVYAKMVIQKIRNAIVSKLPETTFKGGSEPLLRALSGEDRGLNLRGSSLLSFVAGEVLEDLLVVGKIGVLVDAPAEVSDTVYSARASRFRPYLCSYKVEDIDRLVPADRGDTSDWKLVSLINTQYDTESDGPFPEQTKEYLVFKKETPDSFVTFQKLNDQKDPLGPEITLQIKEIPFVLFDIGMSLIQDAVPYQIQLLNMQSMDTAYCQVLNRAFMVRHKDGKQNPAWQQESDDANIIKTGFARGLWYEGNHAPSFISPSAEPIRASIANRQESKKEIEDIVLSALMAVGGSEDVGSGLAWIGEALEKGLRRLFTHWATFENVVPSLRKVCEIRLPRDWVYRAEKERLELIEALSQLQHKIVGEAAKKSIQIAIIRLLIGLTIDKEKAEEIEYQVGGSRSSIGDPLVVVKLVQSGAMSIETAAEALGSPSDEPETIRDETADKAALLVAAQTQAAEAGRENRDLQVDPDGQGRADKELSRERALRVDNEDHTRGENV